MHTPIERNFFIVKWYKSSCQDSFSQNHVVNLNIEIEIANIDVIQVWFDGSRLIWYLKFLVAKFEGLPLDLKIRNTNSFHWLL